MTHPDEIVSFARALFSADGLDLRETTEAHLRKLALEGESALLGVHTGTGVSTARALFLVATGRVNHELPRHERRVIAHYADGMFERQRERQRAVMAKLADGLLA